MNTGIWDCVYPGMDELDAAEQGGQVGVLVRHVGLIRPDAPVQPREQVHIVRDAARQLLRRVHMRVDQAFKNPCEIARYA